MKALGKFKKHIKVGQLNNIVVLKSPVKALSVVFIFSLIVNLPLSAFSQDNEYQNADLNEVDNSESVKGEADNDLKNRGLDKHENNPAYRVLGRNLTVKEDYAADYTAEEIEKQFLPKELALTYVRAAIAVGEATYAAELISRIPLDPKPFEELVQQFSEWKNIHGNLKNAVNAIYLEKLDNEKIFQKAVKLGYKEVFGQELAGDQEQKIYDYLKAKKAVNFDDIENTLIGLMTPDVKKKILEEVLNDVGREDLLKNESFTKKILKQDFTYIELKKLVGKLKKSGEQ